MRQLVESLRRLYQAGRVDLLKIQTLLTDGKITLEEYDYIVA